METAEQPSLAALGANSESALFRDHAAMDEAALEKLRSIFSSSNPPESDTNSPGCGT